jgi:hypothetical protein
MAVRPDRQECFTQFEVGDSYPCRSGARSREPRTRGEMQINTQVPFTSNFE